MLKAALECFLADEYHKVTTRLIAEKAGANISMIRYYFGNKEGLYEEMIRETLKPLLDVLDGRMLSEVGGFSDFLRLYYDTMSKQPESPKLILKVLALNQGPGHRFIQQLLERGRTRGAQKVEELKAGGYIDAALDPDIVRMAFVSLAMTPMLLKKSLRSRWAARWMRHSSTSWPPSTAGSLRQAWLPLSPDKKDRT